MRENWYWIELIGFDNTRSDYGADAFLERLAGRAEGISLLFSSIDFINLHISDGKERVLKPCDCSYGAHKYSSERERQVWTNVQLRGLISEMHKRGVKVLVSFFNFCDYADDDGKIVTGEYCSAHPELWDLGADGKPLNGLNVLKRLKDRSYYEDYLIAQTLSVCEYYGFDGVQVADGISSPRPSVYNGDFSDDLTGQFLMSPQGKKTSGISPVTQNDAGYKARRKLILDKYLYEWLDFISDRFALFYKKFYDGLGGKILLFNNAWTRDPFEAFYRYGIDYKKLYSPRMYGFMIEEVSATQVILGNEDRGGFKLPLSARRYYHYEYALTQREIKVYVPDAKQIALAPINDTCEQWDVIRHAPTEMARALARRGNNYILRKGRYELCNQGPFYCLSDGIAKEDWAFLEECHSKPENPEGIKAVAGFTSLWSDTRMRNEVKEYIRSRTYSSTELNNELIRAGIDIGCSARIEELDNINSALLVTNPGLLSPEEQQRLTAYVRTPVFAIGNFLNWKRKPDLLISGKVFDAALYNLTAEQKSFKGLKAMLEKLVKTDKLIPCSLNSENKNGAIWTSPLRYVRAPEARFSALAKLINNVLELPRIEGGGCRMTVYKINEKAYRVFISNDEYNYNIPKITLNCKIKSARPLLKDMGYQVKFCENIFYDRIPPRGADIIEIETE